MSNHTVIYQSWDESEAGWGIRPDGFSLHKTEEDRVAYNKRYWAGMPRSIPHEYSREAGHTTLAVSDDVFKLIQGDGLRVEQWDANKKFTTNEAKVIILKK